MPWSIFQQGGGDGAAYTWAKDLLRKIGAPLTPGNQQFIFDWEVSEGGGGTFNPLNQGVDPNNPTLTSSGNQYGGGAANYVSWAAGLQGASDFLSMPNFVRIKDDLVRGNPVQARADLIASPWASSHYYGGAGFSDKPLPGHATALPPGGQAPGSGGGGFSPFGFLSGIANLPTTLTDLAVTGPVVLIGAALIVWGAARATGTSTKIRQQVDQAKQEAPAVAAAAAA